MEQTAIIALDASTPHCPVVVGRTSGELLASSETEERANQASATLVPRLEALLAEAGVDTREVAAVACGRGPGTFTGTRVAIATAMGLALGLGVPALPLSTLAIIAASADLSGRVRATLDARRGELYVGTFDVDPTDAVVLALGEERCVAPASAFEDEAFDYLVGPGVDAYRDVVPTALAARVRPEVRATPRGLWLAARAALARGATVDPAAVEAVYLRRSYAELGLNTPKRAVFRSPFVD